MLLLLLITPLSQVWADCTNDTSIVQTILNGYNRHQIAGGQAQMTVEMWIQDIEAVSDMTADFQMDAYISEMWLDPALSFSHLAPCKNNISLPSSILSRLWTPNTVFINSKSVKVHSSPYANVFVLLYANGSIWTNTRLNVIGPCSADLSTFPMDTMTCSLVYESFSYNNDQLNLRWGPGGTILFKEITLPDMTLTSIKSDRTENGYPAGMWTEITVSFWFKRRYGWYILQAYVPSGLTVFVSWLSFCLGQREIAARAFLNINAFLALTFQFGNIMRNLPRVSYVKAIDTWMFGCLGFVFLALIEMAWVGCLVKERPKGNGKRLCCIPRDNERAPLSRVSEWAEEEAAEKRMRMARAIDALSVILFPTFFSVLNIVYWTHYMA